MPLSAGRSGALRSILCVRRSVGGLEIVCGTGGGGAEGAGAGGRVGLPAAGAGAWGSRR
eukprot:COSAG02_NODE_117_length_35386_cov_78.819163_11_plen_59_part_00